MGNWIRSNGGLLAVMGAGAVVLAGYAEWRIDEAVKDQLAQSGFATNDTLSEMKGDIQENREQHQRDSERMDGKIERIVDILLEN